MVRCVRARTWNLSWIILAITLLSVPIGHTQIDLDTTIVLHVKFRPGIDASTARAAILQSGAREATPMSARALPGSPMEGWWVARYATYEDREAAISQLKQDSSVLTIEKPGTEQIY